MMRDQQGVVLNQQKETAAAGLVGEACNSFLWRRREQADRASGVKTACALDPAQ